MCGMTRLSLWKNLLCMFNIASNITIINDDIDYMKSFELNMNMEVAWDAWKRRSAALY